MKIAFRGGINMLAKVQKPKFRSKIRIILGTKFYIFKRHIEMMFSKHNFADVDDKTQLQHKHFGHSTPLLRKLKDVDMYLQYNKIENLKIAVPKINYLTIRHGEVFSYWKLVGKPSKRKGYKKGMILKSGSFYAGTGGGLYQLTNLIYWMTIHTPLTVLERHRHGYDVFPDSNRTQPFGSGTTCYYNYGYLMIKNETDQTFQLLLEITENDLVSSWLSDVPQKNHYEVYEKEHLMQQEY